MYLVRAMMSLDPAMEAAEAQPSKMKVNRLAKKVNLDKLFKMA
jgi:hypothetical protein